MTEEKQKLFDERPSEVITGPLLRGIVDLKMREFDGDITESKKVADFMMTISGTSRADMVERLMKEPMYLISAILCYLDGDYMVRNGFSLEEVAEYRKGLDS